MNSIENKKMQTARLYELIDQTNKAVERHLSYPEPDNLAIGQFKEMKGRFTEDLLHLLRELNLDIQIHLAA
jgi:hypothetical protein